MNRGIYSTATAMLGAQRHLDVIANNLANVSTTGFKRDELLFAKTMEVALKSGASPNEIGTMSLAGPTGSPFTIFEVGEFINTGNSFDFAIEHPEGMFAVQTERGVRYTRDGSFTLTSDGQLVTKDAVPVLDPNGQPIQIPIGDLVVDQMGTISVDGKDVGQLGLYSGQFFKEGNSLHQGFAVKPITDGQVRWKAIEGSNVNAVESMVEMIALQRHFDLAQRSIQQQDEMTQRLIQSLNQNS
jgi:flagellar basal body rod protein FlgG